MRPALALVVFALCLVVPSASAQQDAHRFEITLAGDSTIVFSTGREAWVRPGMRGIAVDPGARDAMIARFRVVAVADGAATALITGQTTHVSTMHVALLDRPRTPWYRTGTFWVGAIVGAVVGVVARSR